MTTLEIINLCTPIAIILFIIAVILLNIVIYRQKKQIRELTEQRSSGYLYMDKMDGEIKSNKALADQLSKENAIYQGIITRQEQHIKDIYTTYQPLLDYQSKQITTLMSKYALERKKNIRLEKKK